MTQSNKIITVISGTSRGIGKHLAQHYVKQGHAVVGCSRSMPDWSLEGYTHFPADITDESSVRDFFSQIRKQHGQVDNIINNAGIASMNHSILTPQSVVQKVFATNFLGTFLLCREGAKLMQKNSFGRIVNFTTVASPLHLEGEAVYAASKSAVETLTKILAKELAPWKITVNAVGPTPIETDLIRSVPKEKIESLIKQQAIKRMGHFADVQNVIDFFLKSESNFITGQIVYLGGISP